MAKNSRQRHRQRREREAEERNAKVLTHRSRQPVEPVTGTSSSLDTPNVESGQYPDTPRGRCAPLPPGSVPLARVARLRRRIRAKFSQARRTLFPVAASSNRATVLTLDTSLAIVTPNPEPEEDIQCTRKPLRGLVLHRVHPAVR